MRPTNTSTYDAPWFRQIPLPIKAVTGQPAQQGRPGQPGPTVTPDGGGSNSAPASRPVIWFPHAGGGSAALQRAARGLQPGEVSSKVIELYALLMPGREGRFSESPLRSMNELLERVGEVVPSAGPAPILVGHSLGALVASRMAQWRLDRGLPTAALVVMGMSSPDRFRPRPQRLQLPDSKLAEQLDRDFGGVPAVIRENPEALRLFMPVVRADLQILESFAEEGPFSLQLPVVALCGTDDPAADSDSMAGWGDITAGAFELHVLSGDHFFALQRFGEVLHYVAALA